MNHKSLNDDSDGHTFSELLYGFGSGTMRSSSPASRRNRYMSFSHFNRSISLRERSQSARIVKQDKNSLEKFENPLQRMHHVLLRSHFASVLSIMAEEKLIDISVRDRLLADMSWSGWESNRLCEWMRSYAIYIETGDIYTFVESLLRGY